MGHLRALINLMSPKLGDGCLSVGKLSRGRRNVRLSGPQFLSSLHSTGVMLLVWVDGSQQDCDIPTKKVAFCQ